MSNDYFIANLLNIKDENITFGEGIHHEKIKGITYTVISAKLAYSKDFCPNCHGNDIIKYGFKASNLKFQASAGYPVLLNLKKQKMYCKACGRYFLATSSIVNRYSHISNNVKKAISLDLTKKKSIKDIALDNFVSTNTVSRQMAKFDNYFNVDFRSIPKHLCFDEFKSTRDAKRAMSFMYCDSSTGKVVDVIENRQLPFLRRYFSNYPKKLRDKVKTISIDLYAPYMSLIKDLFVNAKIVIDRFHIVGLFTRAFNQTRVDVMKEFSTSCFEYKRLKRYWKIFLKPYSLLDCIHFSKRVHFTDSYVSELDIVEKSIAVDNVLKNTYLCYQSFRSDIEHRNFDMFKKHLLIFKDKVSERMKTSIDTCLKYIDLIKNSFTYEYSNGMIEGINNFVKVLKRVAFGYRRFINFRTRIFLTRNLINAS